MPPFFIIQIGTKSERTNRPFIDMTFRTENLVKKTKELIIGSKSENPQLLYDLVSFAQKGFKGVRWEFDEGAKGLREVFKKTAIETLRDEKGPAWKKLMELRDEVLRILEGLRQEKKIASNQQACVTLYCSDEDEVVLNKFGLEQFAALCIVSEVKIVKSAEQTTVAAEKSSYNKCQRCWNYWPSVGANAEHPDLCERCITVVRGA